MLLTLKKHIHDNCFFYCFITILFLLLFGIFYCSPPSADDLQLIVEPSNWSHLIDSTIRRYHQLNGRILGNMSIVYLLDHPIIDGIVRSGVLFGMIYLIYKIAYGKTKKPSIILFGIVFSLILFVPKPLFRQVYNWGSAFCNYVPPIFIFFFLLYHIQTIFHDKPNIEKGWKWNIILFFLACMGQLFMENFTIYVVMVSILMNGYYYYRTKKISKTLLSILLGSIVGALIMFFAPIYHNLDSRGGYHGDKITSFTELVRRLKENYYTMSRYTWHIHFLIMGVISILCIYLIYKRKKQLSLFDKLSIFFLIITPLYCYGITNIFGKFYQLRWSVIFLDAFLIFGYYVSLLWIGMQHIKDIKLRNLLLFFTLSIFLVNAPMLIVLPLSLRCFYFPYVFMVMILVILFVDLETQFHWNIRFLMPIIVLFVGVVTFSYTYMMFENYRCEEKRTEIITEEMKKKKTKISIPNYPYPDLIECFGQDGRLNYRYQYKKFGDIEFYYR